MATLFSILAWIIPWTEEPGGLQSMGSQSDVTEQLSMRAYIYLLFFGFLSHLVTMKSENVSCSVVSNFLGAHGL